MVSFRPKGSSAVNHWHPCLSTSILGKFEAQHLAPKRSPLSPISFTLHPFASHFALMTEFYDLSSHLLSLWAFYNVFQ